MISDPSNEHREQARQILRRHAIPVPFTDSITSTSNRTLAEDIAVALSSRDAQIREVLEGLGKWVNDEWCWCPQVARDGNGALIHFDACVRTSTLYIRLQPPEKSLPGE